MPERIVRRPFGFAFTTVFVVGIAAFLVFGRTERWVGRTDLEVQFVVTDAEMDRPIPNATIHVHVEPGGFCDAPAEEQFTLTTDKNGHARKLVTRCMCFGTSGPFVDSFGMHLPRWSFYVVTDGYAATDSELLETPEHASRVRRGETVETLSVAVELRKER